MVNFILGWSCLSIKRHNGCEEVIHVRCNLWNSSKVRLYTATKWWELHTIYTFWGKNVKQSNHFTYNITISHSKCSAMTAAVFM